MIAFTILILIWFIWSWIVYIRNGFSSDFNSLITQILSFMGRWVSSVTIVGIIVYLVINYLP